MNTQTLDSLKNDLIVRIKKMGDEKSLREIANTIDLVEKRPTKKQLEALKRLAKPMRKKTDIEDLIKEQEHKIERLKLHKKGLMQGLFPKIKN